MADDITTSTTPASSIEATPSGSPSAVLVAQANLVNPATAMPAAEAAVRSDVVRSAPPSEQGVIQLIAQEMNAQDQSQFSVPIDKTDLANVEVVDLDLVIVSKSGNRYVLPQAALQSTTAPDKTVLKFSSGQLEPMADQLKKTGAVKAVEGGSYRIQATDIKPVPGISDKSGNDFNIGKDNADAKAQEQVEQLTAKVEQLSKTLQSATLSNADSAAGQGPGQGAGLGAGTGKTSQAFSFATPAKVNDNTSKIEKENPDTQAQTTLKAQLQHDELSKVTNVSTVSGKAFKDIDHRDLLEGNRLAVQAKAGQAVSPASNSAIANDLVLPTSANTSQIKFTLDGNNVSDLPPGFKINGQDLAAGGQLAATGTSISRFNLTWDNMVDGTSVSRTAFKIKFEFFDDSGKSLGSRSESFKYGDYRTLSETADVDTLYLLARGISYDIKGTAQNDTLSGGAGHDLLQGGDGNDVLDGGLGDDILVGGSGADTLQGGSGNNTATYALSNEAVQVYLDSQSPNTGGHAEGDSLTDIQNLEGSAFNDTLVGNAAANLLMGGGGDDTLTGAAGADTLEGGAGSNTASYQGSDAAVRINMASGVSAGGHAQGDVLRDIQNLIGSAQNDELVGNAADNLLQGDAGDDTLSGGIGNDSLQGGAGNDQLTGGEGADTLDGNEGIRNRAVYADSDAAVHLNLSTGAYSGGHANGDVLLDIQDLTGSSFNDTMVGNDANNQLDGGAGDDTLMGGAGADTLEGGNGNNTASYGNDITAVNVNLQTNVNTGGQAQGDVLLNIQNLIGSSGSDTLIGNDLANRMLGGLGADSIDGGSGNDSLFGEDGNDTLIGGAGADNLDGGSGDNTVSYALSVGAVQAYLDPTKGNNNGSDALGDVFTNIQQLIGSTFGDFLVGNDQANRLDGNAGNDTLVASLGADTLIGGAGDDTLRWTAPANATSDNTTLRATEFAIHNERFESIEVLDLRTDGLGTTVEFNAAMVQALLDNGNASVLKVLMDGNDKYTVLDETSAGITSVTDKNVITFTKNSVVIANINLDISASQVPADTPLQAEAVRALQHATTAKLTGVALPTNIKTLGEIKIDSLLPTQPLVMNAVAGNAVAPGQNDGKAYMDLTLPGLSNAATVTFLWSSGTLPEGFTINGRPVTNAAGTSGVPITFNVDGTGITRLNLAWNVSADGSNVIPSDFRFQVDFRDTSGQLITSTSALDDPITFHFADYRSLQEVNAIGNDSNQNPKLYIPARGLSYDIQGTTAGDNIQAGDGHDIVRGFAGADTLNGGRGDDTLIGGEGADHLDGGTGTNTASYAGSLDGVTVNLVMRQGSGGDGQGDTLANIRHLIGSIQGDTLTGDDQANRLTGGQGNDVLIGGQGADTLDGGEGNDTASYASALSRALVDGVVTFNGVMASLATPASNQGDAAGDVYIGIENLTGSNNDDLLIGDTGANILDGGGDNDTLQGGLGADTLNGGSGSNTASYNLSSAAVTASLTDSTRNQGVHAAGDTYDNIQNLIGSDHADTLEGNASANHLVGGESDDTLSGGDGADRLDGGDGNDTSSYANATEAVRVNLLTPNSSSVGNTSEASGDVFTSIENIVGSRFNDTLIGNAFKNVLSGGLGADTLMGGGGGDVLHGGEGTDTASYERATARVDAYLNTSLQVFNAGAAVGDSYTNIENLTGSDFDDLLVGDRGENVLTGGSGNDTLIGGVGKDNLVGGAGTDTASFVNAEAAVSLSLATGGTEGEAQDDSFTEIENAIGSAFADVLEGNSGDNRIEGGDGNDTLVGGGGNDSLFGGIGDDVFKNTGAGNHYYDGGEGVNTVSYEGFTTALSISLSASDGNTNGAGGLEFFTKVQNLTGGNQSDTLTGDSQRNTLQGGGNNDHLDGRAGDDYLQGDAGDDTLVGGAGADTLDGGEGSDIASYANATVAITLDLGAPANGAGDAAGDVLINIETLIGSTLNDTFVAGGAFTGFNYRGGAGTDTVNFARSGVGVQVDLVSNTLTGAAATGGLAAGARFESIENLVGSVHADTLRGNAGVNTLLGGSGNDRLRGSLGASDVLNGEVGTNTADYSEFGAGNSLTVNMAAKTGLAYTVNVAGNGQADRLFNITALRASQGNDNITGDDAANTLEGMQGNDSLNGGLGNDTLMGGDGDDALIGGAGPDSLAGGEGRDTASYQDSTSPLTVSLLNPGTNTGDAEGDIFDSIENLTGTAGNDTLTGDNLAEGNVLNGLAGDDTLMGMGGTDTLFGGGGG